MSQLFVITRYKRAVGNDIDNYHEGRREQPLELHQTCALREQRRVAGCDEARGKRARSGGVAVTNKQTNLPPLSRNPFITYLIPTPFKTGPIFTLPLWSSGIEIAMTALAPAS